MGLCPVVIKTFAQNKSLFIIMKVFLILLLPILVTSQGSNRPDFDQNPGGSEIHFPGGSEHNNQRPGGSDHNNQNPGGSDHNNQNPGGSDHNNQRPGGSDNNDPIIFPGGSDTNNGRQPGGSDHTHGNPGGSQNSHGRPNSHSGQIGGSETNNGRQPGGSDHTNGNPGGSDTHNNANGLFAMKSIFFVVVVPVLLKFSL